MSKIITTLKLFVSLHIIIFLLTSFIQLNFDWLVECFSTADKRASVIFFELTTIFMITSYLYLNENGVIETTKIK